MCTSVCVGALHTLSTVHKTCNSVCSFRRAVETGVQSQCLCSGESLVNRQHVVVRLSEVLHCLFTVSVQRWWRVKLFELFQSFWSIKHSVALWRQGGWPNSGSAQTVGFPD